jgi:hypothetical protein
LLVKVGENEEEQEGNNARNNDRIRGKTVHGAQYRENFRLTTAGFPESDVVIVSQRERGIQYVFSTGVLKK